jgi:hypothetical protein
MEKVHPKAASCDHHLFSSEIAQVVPESGFWGARGEVPRNALVTLAGENEQKEGVMLISQEIQENGTVQVEFALRLDRPVREVALVGDFEGAHWDPGVYRMEPDAEGVWRIRLELSPGRSYEFRYLIEGAWYTDPELDQVLNPYGSTNNILRL